MLILSALGLTATVASRWIHDILFDTETWVETVGPIGTDAVVVDALSERVSEGLTSWLDAENRMEELLPPLLSPLAGLVGPWVDDAITDETEAFFESDRYESAWITINERGHAAAVAIIRDQVPFASTEGGVVTVDLEPLLSPVADRVFERLGELGESIPQVLLDRVNLDETIAGIVETYRAEGLPERLRHVQVYESERLAAVQQTTAMLDRLIWALPVLALLFAIAALYFSPIRGLMVVYLLGAAAVGWLLAWLSIQLVGNAIVSSIEPGSAAELAGDVFRAATRGLTTLLVTLAIVAGVGSVAVGWLLYRRETRNGEMENPPVT